MFTVTNNIRVPDSLKQSATLDTEMLGLRGYCRNTGKIYDNLTQEEINRYIIKRVLKPQ